MNSHKCCCNVANASLRAASSACAEHLLAQCLASGSHGNPAQFFFSHDMSSETFISGWYQELADRVIGEQVPATAAGGEVGCIHAFEHRRKIDHLRVDRDAGLAQTLFGNLGHRIDRRQVRGAEQDQLFALVTRLP